MSTDLSALFSSQAPLSLSFKVVKHELPPKPQPESSAEAGQTSPRPQSRQTRAKKRYAARSPSPSDGRTVFVGNIPSSCKKKHVKCLFKECGTVQSVRFRSMLIEKGDLPVKVARLTQRQLKGPLNAYVVFSSEEEAAKSLKLNGTLLGDRHLRVDLAGQAKSHEHKRSVFVGNLPHEVDEEEVRGCFEGCGAVEGVRVVRDAKTGIGKGFGFVTFADSSGVLFAVKQNRKLEVKGRKLRIFRSKDTPGKQFSGMKTSKPVDLRVQGKVKKKESRHSVRGGEPRFGKTGARGGERQSKRDSSSSRTKKRKSRKTDGPPMKLKIKPRHRDRNKTATKQ